MRPKHLDQALILLAVLLNRPELVATGPERPARSIFERLDCGFGLNAGVDQVFRQRADDTVAPGIDLADLFGMLPCGLQYATRGSVYHRGDPTRLSVKR